LFLATSALVSKKVSDGIMQGSGVYR
jgi:hypothetical protein